MARAAQKIRVVDYVMRQDGSFVRVDDLTAAERETLSMALRCVILNTLFAGVATFHAPEDHGKTQKPDEREPSKRT